MELHAWLDTEKGRATWLAEQLGLSQGAVSAWRLTGVPMRHWQRITELTGGAVTLLALGHHAVECRAAGAATESRDAA